MSTFSRLLSSYKQAINIKKINLFKNKFKKTTIQIAILSLKVRVCKKEPPLLAQVCVNRLLTLLKSEGAPPTLNSRDLTVPLIVLSKVGIFEYYWHT